MAHDGTTFVYVLSEYEESGSDHAVATLNRSRLLGLIDTNWPDSAFKHGEADKCGIM